MAENSKREQIIVAIKTELETLTSIKKVQRSVPDMNQLSSIPVTQLPLLCIVSGLPVPTPHSVGRRVAGKDLFLSELTLSLFCYFQDNVEPDTKLSDILDDLWAKLYADPTHGELALNTTLKPDLYQDYWEPFYAFRVDAVIQYSHSTGGI